MPKEDKRKSNQWEKIKGALKSLVQTVRKWVANGFTILRGLLDRLRGKKKETAKPVKQQPGLSCPRCQFRIQIPIAMLLSGEPIQCLQCFLTLSIDRENSKASLSELKKLSDTLQKAEEIKRRVV